MTFFCMVSGSKALLEQPEFRFEQETESLRCYFIWLSDEFVIRRSLLGDTNCDLDSLQRRCAQQECNFNARCMLTANNEGNTVAT